jgi:hypothetical protein
MTIEIPPDAEVLTATEQQCDRWLRWLWDGDDGSVDRSLDRLREACRKFLDDSEEARPFRYEIREAWIHDRRTDLPQIGWVWTKRHGRAWQETLELYLDRYVESAPSLTWPEVMEKCRKVGVLLSVIVTPRNFDCCEDGGPDAYEVFSAQHLQMARFETLPLTVKRLAVIGLRKSKEAKNAEADP